MRTCKFYLLLRFALFLPAVALSDAVSAQGLFQKAKADKLYENKQYYAAAQAFEKELADGKGDPIDTRKKIGVCYLNINRPQTALPWLQQAAGSNADADVCYHYALALQQTGHYAEAIAQFEQSLRLRPAHSAAAAKIESCRFAIANHRVNPYAQFRPATEINTSGGEFGASLYAGNTVYYSSAAMPVSGGAVDQRTGLQYVAPYLARMQSKRLVYPQAAGHTLPEYVSGGSFTYDSIAQALYFAYYDQDNNRSGIYAGKWIGGKWANPELVYQNKRDQVSGQPTIADGGKRLYFSSNTTDGIGQTDLWYIDRTEDGKWTSPVNAGNVINTFGREEFPFVYADTLLFFASDGHPGYGGLDIFCSVIRGGQFSPPVNLRRPFNSPGDDFSLAIAGGNIGLLSSSRNEEMSDDLYIFEGVPSFRYLSGHVSDGTTGARLCNARLTLSVDGAAVQQTVSDSTGAYGFFLHKGEQPMMYVRTIGYKPSLTDVPQAGVEQFAEYAHHVQLQPSTIRPVTIGLYSMTTGNPLSERGIICYNNDGETQILRTDAAGTFKLIRQEDQRQYWIKFSDGVYLTENITLSPGQEAYSLALQPLDGELFIGWLRFKRGSMEAVEMSQALIPHIASVINANPGMNFRIEGFCEEGFEARQANLAMQRAEYIVRRLVDEGVDRNRLIAATGTEVEADDSEDASQRRVEIRIENK
jgi:tetratricopeptide (TPR) repeat protein/outer membrane protein OmpA-like peptidoglycan-associated protein